MFNTNALHIAIAAVAPIISVSVGDPANRATWIVSFHPSATTQQRADAATVITNFVEPVPPPTIPLELLQARIEAVGAWETYVNFMFANATRRNALMRTMMIGKPVRLDDVPLRNSMLGAGLTQVQVDGILAPAP